MPSAALDVGLNFEICENLPFGHCAAKRFAASGQFKILQRTMTMKFLKIPKLPKEHERTVSCLCSWRSHSWIGMLARSSAAFDGFDDCSKNSTPRGYWTTKKRMRWLRSIDEYGHPDRKLIDTCPAGTKSNALPQLWIGCGRCQVNRRHWCEHHLLLHSEPPSIRASTGKYSRSRIDANCRRP